MVKSKISNKILNTIIYELINNASHESRDFAIPEEYTESIHTSKEGSSSVMLSPLTRTVQSKPRMLRVPGRSSRNVKFKVQRFQGGSSSSGVVIPQLDFIIKDPTVTEIECRGESKNILVKKAGIVQKTRVALTREEILNILNEFSRITKIPIIEGTFKAAQDNLILTAVISEILGPRFIIQKINPFNENIN